MRWFVSVASVVILAMLVARAIAPVNTGVVSVTAPRLDRMAVAQRISYAYPVAGVPLNVVVGHGNATRTLHAVPRRQQFASRSTTDMLVIAVVTLLYLAMALLVAWKAVRSREAYLILAFLLSLAFVGAEAFCELVLPSSTSKYAFVLVSEAVVTVIIFVQFFFPAVYPPRRTVASAWILRLGVVVYVFATISYLLGYLSTAFPALAPDNGTESSLLILFSLFVVAAVIEGTRSSEPRYRVPSIAAGSTLILLALMNITSSILTIEHWNVTWFEAHFSWIRYLTGVGMTYAVLRHRLVDLHIVISRAAIFSVFSLCLISLFVIVEWALAVVLERAVGPRFSPLDQTALAALVALFVGISARSIHQAVEHRLNRVFFARRYHALAELHRFALETDAATDANALVDLTLGTLRRNLDAELVAFYAGRPETGYLLLRDGAPRIPSDLDANEELVLRLRRWGEPVIVDNDEHAFAGALVCPMVLRGTLYGFVACGRKRDRTSYLLDERETIASLVHRVGIAYEWLTRESPHATITGIAPILTSQA